MIGPIVTVTVDRPLGSYHPEYSDLYYPVNCGYIQGTIVQNGEKEDAYILGVSKPVAEFTGRVIAIIHREDDIEHKWVVAPEGVIFTREEIRELTYFREQYFKSKISLLYKHI